MSLRTITPKNEPEHDNRYCSHDMCGNLGSICFTTHPGPETRWFCSTHAFPKSGKPTRPPAHMAKQLKDLIRVATRKPVLHEAE